MVRLLTALFILVSAITASASDSFNICRYSYIGDAAKIKPYLKKSVINTKCEKDMTPLLWAGFKGHDDVVKLLIKSGADINAKSTSGRTALTYAIYNNNADMVKYLLKNGAKITDYDGIDQIYESTRHDGGALFPLFSKYIKNPDKTYVIEPDDKYYRTETTLLMKLAAEGSLDSVKLLVNKGADVNRANSRGETPLLAAMRGGKTDIAEFLLSAGAKADAKDSKGNTLLTYAIKMNNTDLAINALNAGIDANDSVDLEVTKQGRQDEEWISKSTDKYKQQCTYLQMAAIYGSIPIAGELLKHGADIKEKSTEFLRLDALGYAASKGKTDMVKFLIEKGANPYVKYYNSHPQGNLGLYYAGLGSAKYTLLSLAAMPPDRKREIIEYVLSLPKASWYAENETEYFYINTVLFAEADDADGIFSWLLKRVDEMNFALKPEALKIIAEMKQNYEPKEPEEKKPRTIDDDVSDAIDKGDIEAVKKFIADGYDIKTKQPDGAFSAYTAEKYDMALFLLDSGLEINRRYDEERGKTLILWHDRITDENAPFILKLLDRGVDVNQQAWGKNLLDYSLGYKNRDFQKELVRRGAQFVCNSSILKSFVEDDEDEPFFDNDAIKAPREKLLICADLPETIIMLIRDAINDKNRSDKGAYRLMLEAYKLGIKVDYAVVSKWLTEVKTKKDLEDAKVAVKYFSGIE